MQPMNSTLAALAVSIALACIPAFADEGMVTLVFDGNRFSSSSPDLFQGKASLSPGDTFVTRITLTNESLHKQMFFFSLDESESLSSEGQTLLEKADLKIASPDGAIYYEGPMCGPDLYEEIELKACNSGESVELIVTIDVPADLGNEYAMSKDMLHWRFTAFPTLDEHPESSGKPTAAVSSPGSAYDKTGYDFLPFVVSAAALAVVGIAAFALGARKRK